MSVKLPCINFSVSLLRIQPSISLGNISGLSPDVFFSVDGIALFLTVSLTGGFCSYFEVPQIPVGRIISLIIATSFPLTAGPACV